MASEVFKVREAASSKDVESTSAGSIADHGIKPSSTLYVLWMSALDNLEIHCDPVNFTQPSEAPPFAQSSMALSSVQAPVAPPSAQPLLAPPSVHPLVAPPSVHPLVAPPSSQPLVALPPAHPLVAPPSAQPPVVPPFAQTLVSLAFDQESDIFLEDQSPLSPLSPQSSVIDLTDQERSVSPTLSHQDSPLHYVAPIDEVDLQTILKKLLSKVDENLCPTVNQINICRENILQCSLQAFKRRRFNPEAKLDIVFVDAEQKGEGAVDEGGPSREYMRLLMRAIHQSKISQGHEKDRSLALDTQEGECNAVTLEMIMEFATGAYTVPPLGFPHHPQIEFLHQDGKFFPEANTCLIVLRLPIHTEYEMFKKHMTEGIVQSPSFGVA
ncbi:uncharacterized protein [Sinocyclocheilus grahami]|uniref:uncharacterized protein n=1 Tax=Sinocyclocheilus grahami TaxID=75366 RepID=UPI0007AD61D4|nr:PREDICTED: uncharacterized protein LOC107559787 [Sinocyclocheilus grahami]